MAKRAYVKPVFLVLYVVSAIFCAVAIAMAVAVEDVAEWAVWVGVAVGCGIILSILELAAAIRDQ